MKLLKETLNTVNDFHGIKISGALMKGTASGGDPAGFCNKFGKHLFGDSIKYSCRYALPHEVEKYIKQIDVYSSFVLCIHTWELPNGAIIERPRYELSVAPGNLVTLSGTDYAVANCIYDATISSSGSVAFMRLDKNKFSLMATGPASAYTIYEHAGNKTTLVPGVLLHGDIYGYQVTYSHNLPPRATPKQNIMFYLAIESGMGDAVRRYLGPNAGICKHGEEPEGDYIFYTGSVPRSCRVKNIESPWKVYLHRKDKDKLQSKSGLLAVSGALYCLYNYPVEVQDDTPSTWVNILGMVLQPKETPVEQYQAAKIHLEGLGNYVTPYVRETLMKEYSITGDGNSVFEQVAGKHIDDINFMDMLAMTPYLIGGDTWNSRILFNKRFRANYVLLNPTIIGLNKIAHSLCFSGDDVYANLTRAIDTHLSLKGIYTIKKSSALKAANNITDQYFTQGSGMLSVQNMFTGPVLTTSVAGADKDKWSASGTQTAATVAVVSDPIVCTAASLGKGHLTPQILNPYCPYDEHKQCIIPTERDLASISLLDKMLNQLGTLSPIYSEWLDKELLDRSDLETYENEQEKQK